MTCSTKSWEPLRLEISPSLWETCSWRNAQPGLSKLPFLVTYGYAVWHHKRVQIHHPCNYKFLLDWSYIALSAIFFTLNKPSSLNFSSYISSEKFLILYGVCFCLFVSLFVLFFWLMLSGIQRSMWVAVRAERAVVLELLWAEGEENLLENLLFSWAST